jgi:hypothetical protein
MPVAYCYRRKRRPLFAGKVHGFGNAGSMWHGRLARGFHDRPGRERFGGDGAPPSSLVHICLIFISGCEPPGSWPATYQSAQVGLT